MMQWRYGLLSSLVCAKALAHKNVSGSYRIKFGEIGLEHQHQKKFTTHSLEQTPFPGKFYFSSVVTKTFYMNNQKKQSEYSASFLFDFIFIQNL
jgi:hypothetical protein